MRFATSLLTAAVLLFSIAPVALADSIQLSANSSLHAVFSSPSSSWWGQYSTLFSSGNGFASIGLGAGEANFSSVSLLIPEGNVVTSATISIIVPTTPIRGTRNLYVQETYASPFSGPSVAPSFSGSGTSEVSAWFVDDLGYSSPLIPIINGNKISTGDLSLVFNFTGNIYESASDPGLNWSGALGGDGQVYIPYTVQLDVSYSPLPEPGSIALLGTGLLGLVGIARRKVLS